jgi:hypothetical protein
VVLLPLYVTQHSSKLCGSPTLCLLGSPAPMHHRYPSLLPALSCCCCCCACPHLPSLVCCLLQNLREAITTYRGRLMAETKESRRAQLMGVCLEYLERYYMLIAFTSYLTWPKFDPAAPGHVTFQDWMDSRPELRSVLSRMLRRCAVGGGGWGWVWGGGGAGCSGGVGRCVAVCAGACTQRTCLCVIKKRAWSPACATLLLRSLMV